MILRCIFIFILIKTFPFFFFRPNNMLDIISPTKDWTCAPFPPTTPAVEAWSLNHWKSPAFLDIHIYTCMCLSFCNSQKIQSLQRDGKSHFKAIYKMGFLDYNEKGLPTNQHKFHCVSTDRKIFYFSLTKSKFDSSKQNTSMKINSAWVRINIEEFPNFSRKSWTIVFSSVLVHTRKGCWYEEESDYVFMVDL